MLSNSHAHAVRHDSSDCLYSQRGVRGITGIVVWGGVRLGGGGEGIVYFSIGTRCIFFLGHGASAKEDLWCRVPFWAKTPYCGWRRVILSILIIHSWQLIGAVVDDCV